MGHHTVKHDLNESQCIYRYMDMSKFTLLMWQKMLWFSRADRLRDDHEGSLPDSMIEKRKLRWTDENHRKRLERGSKEGVKDVLASCWSMKRPESYDMWKIYTPEATGIAIKSTVGRLASCFVKKANDLFEENEPMIAKIKYIDFYNHGEYKDRLYERFLHKQQAYAYEEEIRALISYIPTVDIPPTGIGLEVDLDILIEQVYVSNRLGEGLKDVVECILHEKGLEKNVLHPLFARPPHF